MQKISDENLLELILLVLEIIYRYITYILFRYEIVI